MSLLRTLKIVAGITLASALAGAAAGAATVTLLIVLTDGPRELARSGFVFAVAAVIGGTCGALLGPIASFGFLRRVPIGRLFGETALGTIVGGLGGLLLHFGLIGGLATGAGGFLAAALRLARVNRAAREPAPIER